MPKPLELLSRTFGPESAQSRLQRRHKQMEGSRRLPIDVIRKIVVEPYKAEITHKKGMHDMQQTLAHFHIDTVTPAQIAELVAAEGFDSNQIKYESLLTEIEDLKVRVDRNWSTPPEPFSKEKKTAQPQGFSVQIGQQRDVVAELQFVPHPRLADTTDGWAPVLEYDVVLRIIPDRRVPFSSENQARVDFAANIFNQTGFMEGIISKLSHVCREKKGVSLPKSLPLTSFISQEFPALSANELMILGEKVTSYFTFQVNGVATFQSRDLLFKIQPIEVNGERSVYQLQVIPDWKKISSEFYLPQPVE